MNVSDTSQLSFPSLLAFPSRFGIAGDVLKMCLYLKTMGNKFVYYFVIES